MIRLILKIYLVINSGIVYMERTAMKNIRIFLYIVSAIIICGCLLSIPLPALAWGDNSEDGRPSYTIEEINNGAIGATPASDGENYKDSPNYPGQIIFNTISDSVIGNEKNFVGAREYTGINAGADNFWHGNDITVEDGKTYIIRLFVHNNNPNGMDAVAEDVKVAFSIPQTSSTQIEVNGLISSSNATPSQYWDYVNFNSDIPFHLEYVKGSALLENNGIGLGGIQLSDDIVNAKSGGILIGYDALDGRVPGCYQYDNYVSIRVKVVYENITRPTYSYQQINEGALGDDITFNSIKVVDTDAAWAEEHGLELPLLGNETNFVGAREDTGKNEGAKNVWKGTEIAVEDGKTYIVRLYVHNNSPSGMDAVAEDTKVRFYIPYASSDQVTVNGWLASSNAVPAEYSDTVVFKSKDGVPFSLYYVPGSALLENGGFAKGAGVQLPDSITNQGNLTNKAEDEWTLIGYDALDGRVPGCYEYINYVSIRVRVAYDYEFSVENKVRLADGEDKTWQDTIEAKVGDKVEFQFQYINASDYTQNGVVVRDLLPSNLRYVEGSTIVYNGNHPNGVKGDTDDVINGGVNIGSYGPKANAYIRITAEVVDDDLAEGKNTMISWAQTRVGDKTLQDDAGVVVYKNTKVEIAIKVLSVLSFICSAFALLLLFRMFMSKKHRS